MGTPASVICASETLHLCAGEVGLLRSEVCKARYDSANTKRKLWRLLSRQSPRFGKDPQGFTSNFSAEEKWSTSSLAGPSPVGLHAFRRTRPFSGDHQKSKLLRTHPSIQSIQVLQRQEDEDHCGLLCHSKLNEVDCMVFHTLLRCRLFLRCCCL